jgi:hypothetical protein
MISIHPGRRGRGSASLRAALAAAALLAATAASAPGVAHAGTYPMYACDVPGINLPAPTRAAWAGYDSAGPQRRDRRCRHRRELHSGWNAADHRR